MTNIVNMIFIIVNIFQNQIEIKINQLILDIHLFKRFNQKNVICEMI